MKFTSLYFHFTLLTLISLINLQIISAEAFKPDERVEDPTRIGITETQRMQEAADLKERYDQTNEELRKKYEKLSKVEDPEGFIADVISKKEVQKKFASGDQKIQLQAEIDTLSGLQKRVTEADKILSKPETQKLIQQQLNRERQVGKTAEEIAKEKVAAVAIKVAQDVSRLAEQAGIPQPERPLELPYKQPSLFTRVLATVNEGWARVQEWMGNKDRAIEVYNKLNDLYQKEYGKEGVLYQARTNAKIAGLLDNAQAKLQQHIEALKKYQTYADAAAQSEVKQTINDILLFGKQVSTADISASLRHQLDTEIDTTLKIFNIPTGIRVRLEEQVGIIPLAEGTVLVEDINKQIEQMRTEFADLNRDTLDVFKTSGFNNYLENVRQLELSALSLPTYERQRALLTIIDGYQVPAEAAISKLVTNGSLSPADRVDLLNQFLTFNKKFIEAHQQFAQEYRQLVKSEGITPTAEELQGLSLYSAQQRNLLSESIDKQVAKIIEALKDPKSPEKIWNDFTIIMQKAPKELGKGDKDNPVTAVTPDSLQARAAILKEAYGRVLEAVEAASITTDKYADQYANILTKLYDVVGRESTRLSRDAASLINIKPDNTLELMNAAPPPPPPPPIKTPREQKQEKFVTDNKPPASDERQKVFFDVINFNTKRLNHIENPSQKDLAKSKATELHSALATALDARSKFITESAKDVEESPSEAFEWD